MNLPTASPSPLDWHPAYADETWLLRWLYGRDGAYTSCYWEIEFRIPRVQTWIADPDPVTYDFDRRRMSRHRCSGFAPYVGRPFVYEWWAGVDDLGRCIAGEARIVFIPADLVSSVQHPTPEDGS